MNRFQRRAQKKALSRLGISENEHQIFMDMLNRRTLEKKLDLLDWKIDHDIPIDVEEFRALPGLK